MCAWYKRSLVLTGSDDLRRGVSSLRDDNALARTVSVMYLLRQRQFVMYNRKNDNPLYNHYGVRLRPGQLLRVLVRVNGLQRVATNHGDLNLIR